MLTEVFGFIIILGTVIDKDLGDRVRATIIATDFVDGVVMKSPRIEVPKSKLSGGLSLDTPSFMQQDAAPVPTFKPSDGFSVPVFHAHSDEKK